VALIWIVFLLIWTKTQPNEHKVNQINIKVNQINGTKTKEKLDFSCCLTLSTSKATLEGSISLKGYNSINFYCIEKLNSEQ